MMPPRPRPDFLDTWVSLWLSSAVTMAHLATAPFDAFRDTWDANEEEMGAAHEPVPDDELPPVSTVSAVRPDAPVLPGVATAATETCRNCRHFNAVNAQAGECRLDGPILPEFGARAEWPITASHEWCGRFLQAHVPGGLTREELRGLN